MRHPLLPLLLSGAASAGPLSPLPAQVRDSLAPAARAARIEQDLRAPVTIRGRAIVRAALADRMRELGVPAVGIAVVEQGRLAWARAYGLADVASGRRATTATRFQAASISKPVAATGALRLVASRQLALDADVNAVLRSWEVPASPAARGRPVTLRGLLTHSAGLTVHGFPGYAPDAALPSVVQILDGAPPANTAPVRIDTTPGVIWRYSGGGMTVMQLLMTDVTGKRFPDLMNELVLEPAGMGNSTFEQPLPDYEAVEAATGYRPTGDPVAGRWHVYPEMAAAGLWTTPSDLARWIVAVQHSLAGTSGALLPRPLATAMVTSGIGGWGLGVGLEGAGDARRFVHGGSNEGFRSAIAGWVTGGRGVVVMTNGDLGAPIAEQLVAATAREYGWPGYEPRDVVPIPIAPAVLDSMAGGYTDPDGGAWVTRRDGDDLTLVTPGGARYTLVATAADEFTFTDDGGRLRLERDADGRVVALLLGQRRLARAP